MNFLYKESMCRVTDKGLTGRLKARLERKKEEARGKREHKGEMEGFKMATVSSIHPSSVMLETVLPHQCTGQLEPS